MQPNRKSCTRSPGRSLSAKKRILPKIVAVALDHKIVDNQPGPTSAQHCICSYSRQCRIRTSHTVFLPKLTQCMFEERQVARLGTGVH